MPLLETKGAASAQGFGLTLGGAERVFIEDVMSVFLYTGNGSTQTINNGIDLAGRGGLVWIKPRVASPGGYSTDHTLTDTARGAQNYLRSNTTTANTNGNGAVQQFNSNGFGVEFVSGGANPQANESGVNFASWTFRKQPKFFDVVTYTGNGSTQAINHSLGTVPGMMIVKATSTTGNWPVYHRSLGATQKVWLNVTNAASAAAQWNNTEPTATQFTVGTDSDVNSNGVSYVAYLFAHDAGGFGLTGTDNVISCGSFTTDGSGNATVTLGYEPQFVITKRTDSSAAGADWCMWDTMRGMSLAANGDQVLYANTSAAESVANGMNPTATGFGYTFGPASASFIYIAIRRGPMRVPTSGTSVFAPIARTGTNAAGSITTVGFPPDLSVSADRTAVGRNPSWTDRLRGSTKTLYSDTTNAEFTSSSTEDLTSFARMNGVNVGTWNQSVINAPSDIANWFFRRAPGFFDVVCYTGTGSARTVTHNLGAVPELMIVKGRSNSDFWAVYSSATGNAYWLELSWNGALQGPNSSFWNNTTPTASVFSLGGSVTINRSASTYVAYLFATVAGVSKVGSYTGTGSTLQINCGFTGGARFVLIKRTDSTGDWYVWDTARGIVAGNDPYLALNSTAAEVTTTDWVDTFSSGFELSNVGGNNVNINTATYIYLAIV